MQQFITNGISLTNLCEDFGDILLSSQTVDIDKSYRQRSQIMYLCSKLGPWTFLRRITYSVGVDEQTHDLVDAYSKVGGIWYILELISGTMNKHRKSKFPFIKSRILYRPTWYPYFDSFVDDFDYPMEDPYITQLNKLAKLESEERQNEVD